MKKYFFYLVLLLGVSSCSLDDDSQSFALEVLPIESVDIADEFIRGETFEITMTYTRPSDCFVFNDFIYQSMEIKEPLPWLIRYMIVMIVRRPQKKWKLVSTFLLPMKMFMYFDFFKERMTMVKTNT